MSSNAAENRNAWDTLIRELVAKGEVPEDVLYDSGTILQWWRGLDPTRQEEIKSRAEELSPGVFAQVPDDKTTTGTERTWKPAVAVILMWLSIFTATLMLELVRGSGIPLYPSIIVLSVLPIYGGYCALRRRRYKWALAGSLISILGMPPLGIPAVVLIERSKGEFQIGEKTEGKPHRSLRPRPPFVVAALVVLLFVVLLVIAAVVQR